MNQPLLLRTLSGEKTERPPIWYMRQAGRVLPSYLALKEKHSFWQMMKNPELGAQVTLLPVHELGVDAAILFTDILVIPYAMGMGLDFTNSGPVFEKALSQRDNPLNSINPDPDKLTYIYDVIDKVVEQKPEDIPLIGFCGGPLTVLCYMLEGLSKNKEFPEAMKFIYQHPETTGKLVSIIEELSLEYMEKQVAHGIKVFQLFETHGGLVPFELYKSLFLPMMKQIAGKARELEVPFIFFPKDIGTGIREITPEHCDYLSIDWQTSVYTARELVHPDIGLQGNLDPRALLGNKHQIENTLRSYLKFGRENQNWIFNLGHGFKPGIPYENIQFMTQWLKNADWGRG